jgi:hypothetical protein
MGEVDRESVGVVQLERLFPAHFRELLHAPEPALDRLEETLLLGRCQLGKELGALHQLGIVASHRLHDLVHEVHQRWLAAAHEVRMPHRPAQDAPQHVASPLVGRVHAVGEEEGDRARVIGQDAERRTGLPAIVGLPDDRFGPRDERQKEVGVEVRLLALHDRGDPLQPRAGVHRGRGQRHQRSAGLPVVLHENEVPDLQEAPGLRGLHELVEGMDVIGRTSRSRGDIPRRRAPCVRSDRRSGMFPRRRLAKIHVDLAARPARPRLGHLPEVVLVAQAVDPLVRHAGDLAPEPSRLVVLMMDADPDAGGVDREPVPPRHELPRERYGVPLEVVAEGEVAQHLEEGVVPVGVADLLEVVVLAAGADALLGGGGAPVVPVLHAQEGALELHHSGVGEQQGGVVGGREGGRRHLAVIAGDEEVEEAAADRVGEHRTWKI